LLAGFSGCLTSVLKTHPRRTCFVRGFSSSGDRDGAIARAEKHGYALIQLVNAVQFWGIFIFLTENDGGGANDSMGNLPIHSLTASGVQLSHQLLVIAEVTAAAMFAMNFTSSSLSPGI
jgi:hypothetical protein